VKQTTEGLGELEELLKFAPDHTPTVDEVKNINELSGRLVAAITGKTAAAPNAP